MKIEYIYLPIVLSFALVLSYADNLSAPILKIFIEIFTLSYDSIVFPFTIAVCFITFFVALVYSHSFVFSLSLPFAFLGLFELLWHAVPNPYSIDPLGIAVVLVWASIGFVSVRRWKITFLTIILTIAEIAFFSLWIVVGFSYDSFSIALNIITKELLGLVFLQAFCAGYASSTKKDSKTAVQTILSRIRRDH